MTMFDPEKMGRLIRFLAEVQKETRMVAPLPPFDLVSVCPKCGMRGGQPAPDPYGHARMGIAVKVLSDRFPIEYHAGGALPFGRFPCALELEIEHLHRTCPRCGFGWAEACPQFPDHPMDTGPTPDPAIRLVVIKNARMKLDKLREMVTESQKQDDHICPNELDSIVYAFSALLNYTEAK